MRITNAFSMTLIVAALAATSFTLSPAGSANAASATPLTRPPIGGSYNLYTYYGNENVVVGQRTEGGNCGAPVQWGVTTSNFTVVAKTCGQGSSPAARPLNPPKGGAQQVTYYSDATYTTEVGQRFSTSSSPCPAAWGITTDYYKVVGIACP